MEFNELIDVLADETKYTKREVRSFLRLIAKLIGDNIAKGRDVNLWGVGKFVNRPRGPSIGRNRWTGEHIDVPAMRCVRFRPCVGLKKQAKSSIVHFQRQNLEQRYGLKQKEETDGKIRSSDRSEQGTQRKKSWIRR